MKNKPIYQKIYDDIREEIRSGKYQAGDRIMSEKELARKYNVSRITSKQALEMLAYENLIIRRPGLGSFVSDQPENAGPVPKLSAEYSGDTGTGAPKTIGVIFDSFDFAFGCDLLRGIEWECSRQKMHMYFRCTYGDINTERESIREVMDMGVSGIIIMCVHNEVFDDSILRCFLDGFPIILVDRNMAKVAIPCVTTDNYAAARDLTELLFRHGNRKICFVSHVNHSTSTIKARLGGFKDAHLNHGIIVEDQMCLMDLKTCTPTELEGVDTEYAREDEDRLTEYISRNPEITAYFASQYKIGMIVLRAVKKLGLQEKIDVVFFDGPTGITLEKPYYARVIQNENEMGQTAVRLLKDTIAGKKMEGDVFIPYSINKN